MEKYFKFIEEIGDDRHSFIEKIFFSFCIFLAVYIIRFVMAKIAERTIKNEKKRHKLMALSRFFMFLAAIYITLYVWFSHAKSVGMIVAISFSLIALALKDLIIDIFAFVYISFRRPFAVGDLIQVKGTRGEVVDMDFLQFNLREMGDLIDAMSPTGRYVSFPNRFLFEEGIYNYNREDPFLIQDISILIDFESDRQKALEIAGKIAYEKYLQIVESYEKKDPEIFKKDLSTGLDSFKPKIRAALDANGFKIFIQFFTSYDEIGKNKMIIENALYDAFKAHGIKMPTPQYIRNA